MTNKEYWAERLRDTKDGWEGMEVFKALRAALQAYCKATGIYRCIEFDNCQQCYAYYLEEEYNGEK